MRVRFITLLLGLSLCGCATYQDYHYRLVQRYRADAAFKENFGWWSGCSHDYTHGWKQGYFDVANGQCEELPATPPHEYWDPKYQSPEGRAAIEDWYSGWQDGATAAVQDGRPYFHQVVASPTPPVDQYDPHNFHCGPGASINLEAMPPAAPTHEPQPQVYVAPAPRQFANQSNPDEELLDESALPVSYPVDGDEYFNADESSVPEEETLLDSVEDTEEVVESYK
jgi:hypothetical protein